MDPDSCHRVFHTCGHHAGPHPSSHLVPPVPYETPCWSPDPEGALATGLHIHPISACAPAAAPHHAAVRHIQLHLHLHLHIKTQVSQIQEELTAPPLNPPFC